MVPDADLQLKATMKALAETVTPAVDPENKVAQEQLHLAIATLHILQDQLPRSRRFYRAISGDTLNLCEAICAAIGSRTQIDAARSALVAALEDPALENYEIERMNGELSLALAQCIESLDACEREKIDGIVLEGTALPIERKRAWFIGSGFEPNAASLRQIDELI